MSLVDNQNWPLNTILVSQKYKVLYTPVAKNANTTLKRLFVRLSGHPKTHEILRSGIHTYLLENRTGLVLADYTPEVATEILQDSAYFRFIVLREPLKRVVSGYLEKFVVNAPLPGDLGEPFIVIKRAIDWAYERRGKTPDYAASISFNQFAE